MSTKYQAITRSFGETMADRARQSFEVRGTPDTLDQRAEAANLLAGYLSWLIPATRDMLMDVIRDADAHVGALSEAELASIRRSLNDALVDWQAEASEPFDRFAREVRDGLIRAEAA